MIEAAMGVILVVIALLFVLFFCIGLLAMVDQGLDGLITKKIKKRFGGDE